ncbi:hypothetical protein LEP1GSC192_3612 [Leptospira sp. B5-022]|nr:hypothetical protein LEP1GSC192_3612 [Leptospira sp. B5-022]
MNAFYKNGMRFKRLHIFKRSPSSPPHFATYLHNFYFLVNY